MLISIFSKSIYKFINNYLVPFKVMPLRYIPLPHVHAERYANIISNLSNSDSKIIQNHFLHLQFNVDSERQLLRRLSDLDFSRFSDSTIIQNHFL